MTMSNTEWDQPLPDMPVAEDGAVNLRNLESAVADIDGRIADMRADRANLNRDIAAALVERKPLAIAAAALRRALFKSAAS